MKKIFAIALALVMVLSMASAFASPCVTGPFSWDCATTTNKCGMATVEVVPYVTTNSACNEVAYVESDCAAAINGENVYYALKLTIDKDIDPAWWAAADIYYSIAGMTANKAKTKVNSVASVAAGTDESEDGWVYYLKLGTGWFEATENDDFDIATVMNKSVVDEYAKAKVCFYIESDDEGLGVYVGDYYITTSGSDLQVWSTKNGVYADQLVVYELDANGKVNDIHYNSNVCGAAEYATIKAFMGLEIGTCVTDEAIKANFGWDDEVKSCFAWKTQNAMAVVDSECVVAIPKTGDAYVLAWLF